MNLLGAAVLIGAIVLALVTWRTKREGETFEHAYQRILNTDEHKERTARRLAGLEESPTQKPAASPDGEAAGE